MALKVADAHFHRADVCSPLLPDQARGTCKQHDTVQSCGHSNIHMGNGRESVRQAGHIQMAYVRSGAICFAARVARVRGFPDSPLFFHGEPALPFFYRNVINNYTFPGSTQIEADVTVLHIQDVCISPILFVVSFYIPSTSRYPIFLLSGDLRYGV